MRRFYILSLIFVFGFALCLTNGFADKFGEVADKFGMFADEAGGFADDNFIPVENFEFPTADGADYIQGTPEFQRVPENIIDTNDFEKMRDLPPDSQDYILGTKVGMILIPSRFDPEPRLGLYRLSRRSRSVHDQPPLYSRRLRSPPA